MRRLVLSINITADGCCDHTEVIADDELHRYATGLLEHSDGLLLGRVTYQLFESYWPSVAGSGSGTQAEVDFARKLDDKRKYVVSTTLDELHWNNAHLLKGGLGQEVSKLKAEDGNSLLVFGSPGLASALARLGLIDEYQLLVQPIVAGRGPRLFEKVTRLNLRLAETRSFASGVVLLRYSPVRREGQ